MSPMLQSRRDASKCPLPAPQCLCSVQSGPKPTLSITTSSCPSAALHSISYLSAPNHLPNDTEMSQWCGSPAHAASLTVDCPSDRSFWGSPEIDFAGREGIPRELHWASPLVSVASATRFGEASWGNIAKQLALNALHFSQCAMLHFTPATSLCNRGSDPPSVHPAKCHNSWSLIRDRQKCALHMVICINDGRNKGGLTTLPRPADLPHLIITSLKRDHAGGPEG